MTEREPTVQTRPNEPKPTPEPKSELPEPPFEIEDHTDPEFQELVAQVHFMRKWVQAERDAGRLPN